VNALNVKRIKLGNLLTTNPKREFSGAGSVIRIETGYIISDTGYTISLNPYVTHEITLGTNRDGHLVVITKGSNVIHPLGLHSEVSVPFIVLTKEADLGATSDVDILGTHRHEVN
jgi:hypothetical protein